MYVVGEKVHGSQLHVSIKLSNGKVEEVECSTKGMGRKGFTITSRMDGGSGDYNKYWQCYYNSGIGDLSPGLFPTAKHVIAIGEAVPFQKGFDYGFDKPTMLIFKLYVDGKLIPLHEIPEELPTVPILGSGYYNPETTPDKLFKLAKGNTTLRNAAHIREGIVVYNANIPGLNLKIINPKYAEGITADQIS
jgi:hypothetical protein